jgi:hypothetical protein
VSEGACEVHVGAFSLSFAPETMADENSISAGCLSVIHGIDGSLSSLTTFTFRMPAARKEVNAFVAELGTLRTTLDLIRMYWGDHEDLDNNIQALVKSQLPPVLPRCSAALSDLEALVNSPELQKDDRMTWWTKNGLNILKRLETTLQAYCTTIELMLNMLEM